MEFLDQLKKEKMLFDQQIMYFAFIDVNGRVISHLESTQGGVIEITKYKKFNETLFSKFGNKIFFYIIIIYIGLIFLIKRRE